MTEPAKNYITPGGFRRMREELARLLKEHGVEFNILTTVNAANADHPLEVYRFIRDELMPLIKSRYRTTGETAIVGESLAGLFVVTMAGQTWAGWYTYNDDRQNHGESQVSLTEYLGTGHFGEATIQQRLSVETIPPLEALDKHNLATFVRAREGYSWMFLQRDFDHGDRMAVIGADAEGIPIEPRAGRFV